MRAEPEAAPDARSAPDRAADFAAYGDIVAQSLFFSRERPLDSWYDTVGRENFRFFKIGGQVAGGLAIYPAGQYFGGRRLDCGAIAAVAVAPEHRASGAGSRLMRDAMADLHAAGTPLACLFPATQPVYRSAGFEQAGVFCRFRVQASDIDLRSREPAVRRADKADHTALRALYARAAAGRNGWLDRPEVLWKRNLEPWFGEHFMYLVEGAGGAAEGYVIYSQTSEGGKHHVQIFDFVALTPGAAARLLAFFASHRSVIETVTFPDGPGTPLLALLAEPRLEVARFFRWLLRVVDVRAALEGRGYPAGVASEVHLEIADEVLPGNSGRMVLEVAGGRAEVRPGGRGDLRLDVRGLAALYTGHATSGDLALAGLASASHPEADALFGGSSPWLPDMF